MMRGIALVVAFVLSFGCAMAQAAPAGFSEGRNQGVSPRTAGKLVIFSLKAGQCQSRDYGDGRGESDCKNGNSRSQVQSTTSQKIGQSYEYFFEFRVLQPFRYNGRGWGKVNYRSRLLLAEWQRANTIKNHMYEIHLDSTRGATFEDKVCVLPARLSEWNTVSVKARWSTGTDGFLQVTCNGKIIYATRGPNAVPPGCGSAAKLQCAPKLQDLSKPIIWQVGPLLRGHGMNYRDFGFPSPFPPFPEGGVTAEMRNLGYTRLKG